MDLTPEQIDRQPFRLVRKGYDIVHVRDFLREVATEMRRRQVDHDQLVEAGRGLDDAEQRAESTIQDAEARAAEILVKANAQASTDSIEAMRSGEARAEEIIAEAEAKAELMAEEGEARARERSEFVISEAQVRLDSLLAQEVDVRMRLEKQGQAPGAQSSESGEPDNLADARDRGRGAVPETDLVDLMKTTLRDEVKSE